uniref:ATP/GTP-binding protein n=1 Tax=Pararhizobium sp. IMCC3301 TaxID=3067904 RepID=UPI0027403792|nr:ATP-binding protein [Pararhizobium sp. IMCC3301]
MDQHFITFTGAHGVGKTSLIDEVTLRAVNREDISVIREPAREIAKRGFYVNDKISLDGVFEYLGYCLAEARQVQTNLVLTDRSILDLYAYTRDQFPHRFSYSLEKLIIEQIHAEKHKTRLYAYLPIEFPMEDDDLRPADLGYQSYIDGVIRELLVYFDMPTIEVRGSIEERAEQLMDAITRLSETT